MPINLLTAKIPDNLPAPKKPINLLDPKYTVPTQPTTLEGKLKADTSYVSKVAEEQVGGAKKIAGSLSKGYSDIVEGRKLKDEGKPIQGFGNVLKGVVGGVAGSITGAGQALLAPVTPAISGIMKGLTPILRQQNPELAKVYDTIAPKVSELAQKHPESATILSDIVNSFLLIGGVAGAKALGGNAVKKSFTKEALISGKEALIKDVTSGITKVKGSIGNIKTNISESLKGKPEIKILNTPEKDVYKLNPSERKTWFDAKQAEITSRSEVATKKIKDNLVSQSEKISADTEKLQKELATASRDKVIELRPKIIKAMGEQSKVYRKLIDEEMAGKEKIPVQTSELKTYIDSRYGDNPAIANLIKEKLGLGEVPLKPLKKGELPTIQTAEPTKTIGDIYSQTKSLKQDISSGGLKGNKVFTSEDVMTDKAINTLTSFLKEKGVDFSEANKFWTKYAPIRDQLASESKPFLQTGTQTKTFASTLVRVAKGADVNNEIFISEVEKLLKIPINKENKAIVGKITANQKTEIANKLESQEKIIDNEMLKDKNLSKLNSQQFEVERQAKIRSYLKKTIITVLGLEIANKLGITKLLGF